MSEEMTNTPKITSLRKMLLWLDRCPPAGNAGMGKAYVQVLCAEEFQFLVHLWRAFYVCAG